MTYLDQIEKYLRGELSPDECARFEERMRSNPRLAEDTALYKELTGFLSENADAMDKLIKTSDQVNRAIQVDEWNRPEKTNLVDKISKIMVYLGDSVHSEVFHWLRTEAILYPELIENVLQDVDMERFDAGDLNGNECLSMYDHLIMAYETFTSIDSMVEDFMSQKPIMAKEPALVKEIKQTRVYNLPISNLNSSGTNKRSYKILYGIAATIAILIAAGSIFWLVPSGQMNSDQLYADYYSKYTVSTVQRSAAPAIVNDFATGMKSFSNGAFQVAVGDFSKVSTTDINYIPACFFMGLSQMETNQYTAAIDRFSIVMKAGSSNLSADAQWNLALCYLKTGNIDQTRKVLSDIVTSNPFYQKKAAELLGKLAR